MSDQYPSQSYPSTVSPLNRRHIGVDDGRGHALRHISQEPRTEHMNPGKHARLGQHLICASTPGDPHDAVVRIHFHETPPCRLRIFAQDQRRHGVALLVKRTQRTEIEVHERIAVEYQHRLTGKMRLRLLEAAPVPKITGSRE